MIEAKKKSWLRLAEKQGLDLRRDILMKTQGGCWMHFSRGVTHSEGPIRGCCRELDENHESWPRAALTSVRKGKILDA